MMSNQAKKTKQDPTASAGQTAPTQVNAFAGVERLTELNRQFARHLTEASRDYLKGILAIQEELMGLNTGPEDNLERTRQKIGAGKAASEAIRIRDAWARKISERYTSEAQRLVELARATTEHSWSPILQSAQRAATTEKAKNKS